LISPNDTPTYPIARIQVNNDGKATIYSANTNHVIPAITLNNSVNPINQSTTSSNFSMSSSLVSTNSNQINTSSSLASQAPNANNMTSSLQSGNTISASSVAMIDMNNHMNTRTCTTIIGVEHVDFAGMQGKPPAYKHSNAVALTTTIQPTFNSFGNNNSTEKNDFLGDGVKYKFVSNETIGVKSGITNEFDSQSDTESNKFRKCTRCIKCCFVM
jgi:hypothetical protein